MMVGAWLRYGYPAVLVWLTHGFARIAYVVNRVMNGHRRPIFVSFLPGSLDPPLPLPGGELLSEEIWIEKLQPFGEKGYNKETKIRQA